LRTDDMVEQMPPQLRDRECLDHVEGQLERVDDPPGAFPGERRDPHRRDAGPATG
jgi:hypothetical protein